MFSPRWARLCSVCTRVVYRSRETGGWRTLVTGHTRLKSGNITELQHRGTGASKRLCHNDLGDLYKKESVQRYLQIVMQDYRELCKKLQLPHLSDSDRKLFVMKHAELLPLAEVFQSIEQALAEMEEVLSLLHSEWILSIFGQYK